jgi:hypothetical protein
MDASNRGAGGILASVFGQRISSRPRWQADQEKRQDA